MDNLERNPIDFLEWHRNKIQNIHTISKEKELEIFERFEQKLEEMKEEKEETRTVIEAITLDNNIDFIFIPEIFMWELRVQKRKRFLLWKFWETVEVLYRSYDKGEVEKYALDNSITLSDDTIK